MPRTDRPISLCWWDDELAAAAYLHSGNTVLPTLDKAAQREFDGLTATPRAIEFFAGVVLDTHVMHLDGATWQGFGSVADY
jgi:acyl dehydratase